MVSFWGIISPFNMCSSEKRSSAADPKHAQTSTSGRTDDNPFVDVPESDEVVTYTLQMR